MPAFATPIRLAVAAWVAAIAASGVQMAGVPAIDPVSEFLLAVAVALTVFATFSRRFDEVLVEVLKHAIMYIRQHPGEPQVEPRDEPEDQPDAEATHVLVLPIGPTISARARIPAAGDPLHRDSQGRRGLL